MATLDSDGTEPEADLALLATHLGGKTPLSDRFRRAQLRAQMFGDPGETLTVGRYTVTGRIGSGAMGTVYRATDASLDREVALKVLHRSDEMHRARMTIEAKALAKLSHPNVVTVHEVGTEDGQLFVAMELVKGRTLQAWREDPSGPSLLDVFVQAAQGLQAAHDAGIVHRDFKPENVIVGDDGRVRVLDFGMARSPGAPLLEEVDGAAESLQVLEPAITRTGMLAGTPSYMAPEQFEGSRVDARADQFAFCIALHEVIWGKRPFAGETVAELASVVLAGSTQLFEGTPREGLAAHELDAARSVIERGLATNPDDRFDSMRDVAERLRGTPAKFTRIASPTKPRPRRVAAMAVGAAVLGLVAVLGMPPLARMGADAAKHYGLVESDSSVAAEPLDVQVVNECGAAVEFSIGPRDELSPDAEVQRLGAGETRMISITPRDMLWLRTSDGSFGPRVGTKAENGEFVIGPHCEDVSAGRVGEPRVLVPVAGPRCGLGTELKGGACVPLEWDPKLVQCDEDSCFMDRVVFIGSDGNPPMLMKQLRVVPTMDAAGELRGYKVFGVQRNTAASMIGLKTGDLLLSVNEISLDIRSSELTAPLRAEVRKAKMLTVTLERAGEPKTLTVHLRG